MSFEQTSIFYNLVNNFVRRGEELRHEVSRGEKARAFAKRFADIHGKANIKKVCAKANQKLKIKLFTI